MAEEDEVLGVKGMGQAEGAKLGEDEIPPPPVFMQDAPPATGKKMDMIKWGLMHNKSEEELAELGFNPKTVRMAAYDLDKEGWRKREPKQRAKKAPEQKSAVNAGGSTAIADYGKRAMTSTTRALPPEFLIDQIHLPMDGSGVKNFEQGIKFGASMLVLGVRIAQELGNMGMQQAKPIMDMANAMRAGEALAAKNAAAEAAMLAAAEVRDDMMPVLTSLGKPSQPTSADPMKSMLARMMEPMMNRFMGMAMGGLGGAPASSLPDGWTRNASE